MAKKIGVILSGCGVYDGSEIHEAVLTLLAIDRNGAEAVCMAPDVDQMHVVNHLTGEVAAGEKRNVLVEAARIARGRIRDIATLGVTDLDAVILPGGFGAAKNLCDFAVKGPDCAVNPEVVRLVRAMAAAGKPVGAVCIAPVILARILGTDQPAPQLTIGTDPGTADAVRRMGGCHVDCPAADCVVDSARRLVTTPAYMLAGGIAEAARGIDKAVKALIDMAG